VTALEFHDVSTSYGNRTVLSHLSFRIERGERITIQGPSGCGKTTVLRLLAGFVAPDQGGIRIAGREVATNGKILIEPDRRNLGMVFQDLALWPHLTVYQNLEFALKAQGVSEKLRKEKIAAVLTRVRLEDAAGAYPGRLSGGQQQRVAIARALVAQLLALLMDEPLANLDDDLKDELCGHLLDLHSQLSSARVADIDPASEGVETVRSLLPITASEAHGFDLWPSKARLSHDQSPSV
jgi:ABC-type Fe3+/spermidine/putrescine transport system ATPase subunit